MRRDPFDELFGGGDRREPWTDKMMKEILATVEAAGTDTVAEGRRIENVDGDVTEYRLEDGEWVEVGEQSLDGIEVSVDDDSVDITIDSSAFRELRGYSFDIDDATAMWNNGILSIELNRGSGNE